MSAHYINKGDLLEVNGRRAVATSEDYTRMSYSAEDYELMRAGYEGGTAGIYVDVLFPETGSMGSYPMRSVRKV